MPQSRSSSKEKADPFVCRKSQAYRRAFENYIRHGEPIRLYEAKATDENRPTTHYIWRTQKDSKVRPTHRANDGKIFSWDDPPPTGHPGEDFGCRCIAEAHFPEVDEFARQTLAGSASSAAEKWGDLRFLFHFAFGGGATVSLSQIGHLRGIIDHYANTLGAYERVNGQVADAARQVGSGRFQYDFEESYDFDPYNSMIGGATVRGEFDGTATQTNNALKISGTVIYKFHDVFTDPRSIRQRELGTSDPSLITDENRWTEFGGTHYVIEDTWKTRLEALVNANRSKSKYIHRS